MTADKRREAREKQQNRKMDSGSWSGMTALSLTPWSADLPSGRSPLAKSLGTLYLAPRSWQNVFMSPTLLRIGPYRFFFNSREEKRRHVHVATADGTAKFWLEPLVSLATFYKLPPHDLKKVEEIIKEKEHEFRRAWDKHFRE
jgi:hypothetical protein